jgi:hypothetical protein
MEEQNAEQMRARLQQWRQEHPRATFDEIEEAVQQAVVRWQAQLVEELAAEGAGDTGDSSAVEWEGRPVCAACGAWMHRCGTRTREVLSRLGQPLRLERAYSVCPTCGAGVFPPG